VPAFTGLTVRCGAGDGIDRAVHVTAATVAHCRAAVRDDHDALPAAGWSQRCLQFANVGAVEQTAAAPALVCSSKPLLHECVASTAPDAAYERSTLSNETIPLPSAVSAAHFAAMHVGGVPVGFHIPLPEPSSSHVIAVGPLRMYPALHPYAKTESKAPLLPPVNEIVPSAGAVLRTALLPPTAQVIATHEHESTPLPASADHDGGEPATLQLCVQSAESAVEVPALVVFFSTKPRCVGEGYGEPACGNHDDR
jgi:hypothetical protein